MQRYDLNSSLDYGIINSSHIQEAIEMLTRKEVIKKHLASTSIWQGDNGRWYTRVTEKNGTKKLIGKSSKEKLEEAIFQHYKYLEDCADTFIEVYEEWRSYHDQMIGDNSIAKYDTDRKRYFDGREFASTSLTKLTEDDVSVFIRNIIEELRLCKTSVKRMMGYMKNTFLYAERQKYIPTTPMKYLEPKDFYRYCYESERSKKEQVFNKEDISSFNQQFKALHEENGSYIPLYAVELASLTGMRVGEISALTWDNIYSEFILIDKSEKFNRRTNQRYIDKTKNGKNRTFPLTDEIRTLLADVKKVEEKNGWLTEWVFSDKRGRVSSSRISSCVKNRCKAMGIQGRGIHAFRKTLNSQMKNSGVSTMVAASLLGHSEEVNENYYTFDVADMDDKKKAIEAVNKKISEC